MKNKRYFLKKIVFYPVIFLVLLGAVRSAFSSLIDWAKHEEWRRKQLESLLEDVKRDGSAKYVILSFRNYDKNQDGVIDKNESQAIETELRQLKEADAKNKKA